MTQPGRPMSPHLMIYRPQLTSVLSIIHRGTGVGLAVGTVFLTWWLVAAALGPETYEATRELYGTWMGQVVLFGFSVCLFYHLCNGVRHLLWDIGLMLEIENIYRSGWVMLCASAVLTFVAWSIGVSL
ncbi:MAG: succinate dehydrogenase, cytochrome b556 subunit [Proteobacteria bacterium]|nr:succinate dehydrogenase, cytochrome b556 subunit [Pseudomonadota bacterium]